MTEYKKSLNGHAHPKYQPNIKPSSWRAVLMCDNCKLPQTHDYQTFVADNNPVQPKNPSAQAKTIYYRLIYECNSCGTERYYGITSA